MSDHNTREIRAKALDELKLGGDPDKALALAILYVGDIFQYAVQDWDEAIRVAGGTIGASIEQAALDLKSE